MTFFLIAVFVCFCFFYFIFFIVVLSSIKCIAIWKGNTIIYLEKRNSIIRFVLMKKCVWSFDIRGIRKICDRLLDHYCFIWGFIYSANYNLFVCQLYRARSVKACWTRCRRGVDREKRGCSKHIMLLQSRRYPRICAWKFSSEIFSICSLDW